MPKESVCVQVPKTSGESTLRLAGKLGLVDKTLIIARNGDSLCIPLLREPTEQELVSLKAVVAELSLESGMFEAKTKSEKTLAEVLEGKLPPDLVAALPRALDVVGDIAIIDVPDELESHKLLLGEAVMESHRGIKAVWAKAGNVNGVYRLRDLEFLAGEQRTLTMHKEYGCSYFVDVAKAYFSPRLSHEHERVARLVGEGEVVVDLFAGVGPFVVPIADNQKTAKVYAIDINPEAVELLKRNIRLNRIDRQVVPIVGDARKVVDEQLAGEADRVIMNLPETAYEFVDTACKAVKPEGGIVHFYGFIRLPKTIDDLKQEFCKAVAKYGRKVESFVCAKTVRETAPFEWQAVLDAKII
jgi:tRNA (guanine37-N1)-methyltransferase